MICLVELIVCALDYMRSGWTLHIARDNCCHQWMSQRTATVTANCERRPNNDQWICHHTHSTCAFWAFCFDPLNRKHDMFIIFRSTNRAEELLVRHTHTCRCADWYFGICLLFRQACTNDICSLSSHNYICSDIYYSERRMPSRMCVNYSRHKAETRIEHTNRQQ